MRKDSKRHLPCIIDKCERKQKVHGLCQLHYIRSRNQGENFDKSPYSEGDPRTIPERIERFSMPIPESGCIVWIGTLNRYGYALMEHRQKPLLVHRYIYKMVHGDIPKGKWILHKCDVRSCINPNHLYAGTAQQNADDRDNRGRAHKLKGTDYSFCKLTEDIVREIRKSPESNNALAKKYGVSHSTIGHARVRKTWKHVP